MNHRDLAPKQLPRVAVPLIGGLRRSGAIALRPSTTLVTLIGGANLDLTEARIPASGSTFTKVSLIGGVSVVVPPGVRVEVGGFSLIGGRNVEQPADLPPTAPVLRIRAWGVIGGVRVRVGS